MKKELSSKYNHKEVEEGKNQNWIDKKYFQEHDLDKEPFCIVIPPPNVTGKLHLGHAWDTTLQDVIIRYKKMQGFDTLWLPGMDHAGISTQAKVDEKLISEGIDRLDIGREKFVEYAWEWTAEYSQHIRDQWGKLGLALDYSKERFTLDEGLNQAVLKIFVEWYKKGYIYQKERIINWDPEAKTALSNIEVDHLEIKGKEHYFKYYFVDDPNNYLEVMTTRPETILGDGAVAINPKDERYLKYLGKEVYVPVSRIKIPIISDDYVSFDKGSGCVKITPAHDPNDFNVGVRHNVPFRIIMNEDGTMADNEWVPDFIKGLDRFEAREVFLEAAKKEGSLDRVVDIIHNVGHSQRSGAIVEPLLSKQWFVDMKELAQMSISFQNSEDKILFFPERFEKTFLQWMENIEDWCISRQLWWGHRIPVWYHKHSDEIYVDTMPPEDIENWDQDEDVLDTWFSSGIWPFSTLGWPNDTADLKRYYPTNTLVTGYDIIFFWVARMINSGEDFLKQRPFDHVLIHGLVRDNLGRKMSKSLGNGVDPMDVIEQYGADALRYFLSTNSAPGQDLRYSEEKIEAAWNYINKIWNAARYVMMNLDDDIDDTSIDSSKLHSADRWILKRLNETIEEVITNMDKYEYTVVSDILYNFVWDDYCSWYIEMSKATIDNIETKKTLKYVLEAILKMLNPFMPFVTEEIFTSLTNQETIINQDYPQINEKFDDFETKDINYVIELITLFRDLRQDYEIKKANVVNYECDLELDNVEQYIKKIVNFEQGIEDAASRIESFVLNDGHKVVVDLSMVEETSNQEIIDEYEIELVKLEKEIQRAEGMLNNDKFLAKAPEAKIMEEREKLIDYQAKYESIKTMIDELSD